VSVERPAMRATLNKAAQFGREMLTGLQDLMWPPVCIVCKTVGDSFFCPECRDLITPIQAPSCSRCGYPGANLRCPHCGEAPWTKRDPCDAMRQVAVYEDVWRDAILEYKIRGMKCLADELGRSLTDWMDQASAVWRECDAVVAVPGLRIRGWELGFHHAEELAVRVARHMDLPLIHPLKRLPGPDLARQKLTREERMATAKTLYALRAGYGNLYGKRILVIDDIVTTGSTAHAVADQLKRGGAAKVRLLALARTP